MSKPHCILCKSENMKLHFYPPNKFNNVTYNYYKCSECDSLSIYPFPDKASLKLMYNEDFHPYIDNFDTKEIGKIENYKKHTSQRYQLDFLKDINTFTTGKKLLDFGCGGGIYMVAAQNLGYDPTGIEFDSEFTNQIRKKTTMKIFSLDEFEQQFNTHLFDIIHFGHNLEHLENPYEIFETLKKYTHKDTIYIIDGPLENNLCLSRKVIDLISKIKKRSSNTIPPYHLSFTNYDSQLLFFDKLHLTQLKYIAKEQYWPLPDKFDWKRPSSAIKHLLARISIFLSGLSTKQGNIFHFVGKYTHD